MKKYLILLLLTSVVSLTSCLKEQTDPFVDANVQLVKDEEIIKKFIVDNKIAALRHESGLYYQIIQPGSGNIVYSANTRVTVNYQGRLLDGSIFDQSKVNQPISFALGGVIVGWQIGVPLIQKGGKIRLLIPSGYAYRGQETKDNQGKVIIPSNAVLDFDIELLDVQ
jgi:FKBP-type peptidyl-prolyl cis-trans isomerase FkpA